MDIENVYIRKISHTGLYDKEDETAREVQVEIKLKDGTFVHRTGSPSHVEELIAGVKYLGEKKKALKSSDEKKSVQKKMLSASKIFVIAERVFEHPGELFEKTGCAHCCALVRDDEILCSIEDIGRHNALDKIIGYAVINNIKMSECQIFTSGRISGDYMEKIIAAEFPAVVSRAAVTHRAVEFARLSQTTLLGFVRKNTGNIYCEGKVQIENV